MLPARKLRKKMTMAQIAWQCKLSIAISAISDLGEALGKALGDVSIDEAVDALQKEAAEQIDKMRYKL